MYFEHARGCEKIEHLPFEISRFEGNLVTLRLENLCVGLALPCTAGGGEAVRGSNQGKQRLLTKRML